jgi:hypothetical protein
MIDMKKRGGAWREEVWDRIGRMRDTLSRASTTALPAQTRAQVNEHLNRAQSIANDSYWRWIARKGSRIEAAWRELRLAEETYLADAPDDEALVLARRAAQRGAWHLGATDPLVIALNDEIGKGTPPDDRIREHAVAVLRRAHETSDADHRKLRAVGEQIAAAAWGLAALAALLVGLIAGLDWQFLPPVSRGDATIAGWQLVALAMVSGLIGAMFSAIPSVSLIPDKREPFNPVWRQAALKMVIGAWSGFIGLIAVTAGLVEPITQAAQDPSAGGGAALPGFVMTAALFGAGQEAVSRFADRKATIARDTTAAGTG